MDDNQITTTPNQPVQKKLSWFAARKILVTLIAVIIVVGLLVAFRFWPYSPKTVTTPTSVPEPEKITRELHIDLLSLGPSGIKGQAWIFEKNGQAVEVLIQLDLNSIKNSTAVAEAIFPSQIRIGSCPNPTEIKYPLTNVVTTASRTILNINTSQIELLGRPAIVVTKSASESAEIVACGNFP